MTVDSLIDVGLPRLSDSMEEGTILRWLVADGEQVVEGQAIVEIETDKATMEFEAEAAGTLQILADAGQTLPLGAPIARILPAGGVAQADGDGAAAGPVGGTGAKRSHDGTATHHDRRPMQEPVRTHQGVGPGGNGGRRVKASPLARRLAAELGVELAALRGSGPRERIVKADVERAAALAAATDAPARSRPVSGAGGARETGRQPAGGRGAVMREQPTRLQLTVARRMAESKATAPDFTLAMDVDMTATMALRETLREAGAETLGLPSVNDFVVKAVALSLHIHPRANGSFRDGAFERYERVNVGVAVAAQEALVVPTIMDADRKSLGTIAAESRRLAERVRDGTITPPELAGATFTVSNLGMFGVTSFTAVLNPPQAAILAVGAIEQRPRVLEGEIVARSMMSMTLTCDHRILYGAQAAAFLARVRDLLEQPSLLVL
jgi:pyruvate dehydrogenase E2 component (dihydrolipoamide acetyltransferase)